VNVREVGLLLERISVLDSRKVTEPVVEEWFLCLGDLDYRTACEAVTLHRQTSGEWLLPFHVRSWSERLDAWRMGARDEWGNVLPVPAVAAAAVGRLGRSAGRELES
jgi:hypothetical protein